jgi:hypothetical protein
MRAAVIGLIVVLLFPGARGPQPETGTVCVASRAATPFRGQVIPPTGEVSSGGLQVKIDKRPAVAWPPKREFEN